jgi:BirA family biotin operon repressor/biotin-[acetyl-CoA-carboxylase] ligase
MNRFILPSVLWERFIPNVQLGHHLICYDEVASTMDTAWEAVEHGSLTHGSAVIALNQTQGKGRFDRSWVSEPGESLTMSVVVQPSTEVAERLSMIAGLAILKSIESLTGVRSTIKWPNDVRIVGKKVCGILVQTRVDTAGSATAVVGIGLNLGLDVSRYEDIRDTATSLRAATGYDVEMVPAAEAVLRAFDELYGATKAGVGMHAEWSDAIDTLGNKVIATIRGVEETGIAEGVAADGSLLFRREDGTLVQISSGEVTIKN